LVKTVVCANRVLLTSKVRLKFDRELQFRIRLYHNDGEYCGDVVL
jgi:hypothetical protein